MPPRFSACRHWCGAILVFASVLVLASQATAQGVFNGAFEEDANNDEIPDGWTTAGRAGVVQELKRVSVSEGGHAAKLTCTQFEAGFPDSHAMICQLNRVSVRRGQWYVLRLRARAEHLQTGSVSVALVNYRNWTPSGLQETFSPQEDWQTFEFYFRATADLPAEQSRFQIYFQGTGTLWVDDVELTPIAEFRPQRLPQLSVVPGKNAIPNSSFELGETGWGCLGAGGTSWAANLFRLEGRWDDSQAVHGRRSWKLTLSGKEPLVTYFDYFDPTAVSLRRVLIGHEGWIPLEAGRVYEFSAYVKADREGVPVVIQIRQDDRSETRRVGVGTQWTRINLRVTARQSYAYGAVGLDLGQSPLEEATLWIDAVQFSLLNSPDEDLAYSPAATVETCLVTDRPGNIFIASDEGIAVRLRGYNDGEQAQTVTGNVVLLDYRDREIQRLPVVLEVPPRKTAEILLSGLIPGKTGFYRAIWKPDGAREQVLRLAVVRPWTGSDSAFGMNHAFPVDFLLELSRLAGLVWWRDWSCQWRLVQSEPNSPFDFRIPDTQIRRVLEHRGHVLVLLPFPATPWSAMVDRDRIEKEAHGNAYLQQRLVVAQKPRDVALFAGYVRETVRHYRGGVACYEILNEPLYTSYALPSSYGWTVDDYLELLRTAYQVAKEVDPGCTVVGGIAAPPDSRWVREFIEKGGLAWCDVMNLHLYPHRGDPSSYEEAFRTCRELMVRAGHPAKPIWVTEIGCYADDDPPVQPFRVGDEAMNRSLRPNELRAAIDLVKFAAVMGAAGVNKVFYHAGTCGPFNENTAGNVFFEYGGCPRKMFAAQAVLSGFLGADMQFLGKDVSYPHVQAYRFRSQSREVTIAWSKIPVPMVLPADVVVYDLMGNPLAGRKLEVAEEPVYLVRQRP